MRILISGASVAGPVLAYWLHQYGHQPTIVERVPSLRRTGGHAVDLFRPSMGIVEQMSLLKQIEAKHIGMEWVTFVREGAKPVDADLGRALGVAGEPHVEIMRDDLSEILNQALRDKVEYIFDDSIATVDDRPESVRITFDNGKPREFDLVIGADGLRSNVRRLVFGDNDQYIHHLGGYLAVSTVPNHLDLTNEIYTVAAPGRVVSVYSPPHLDEARALFMFHSPRLDCHHRDIPRQKELLRRHFAEIGSEVPRLLDEMDRATTFYFDEISQLRLDTWSRGRVSLVGDAAYCPGPAVGASTSMAVIGAYILAGELATAGHDHAKAFSAYQREMTEYVQRGRDYAIRMSKQAIPDSRAKVWVGAQILRLVSSVPAGPARLLARLTDTTGVHQNVVVKRYAAPDLLRRRSA